MENNEPEGERRAEQQQQQHRKQEATKHAGMTQGYASPTRRARGEGEGAAAGSR